MVKQTAHDGLDECSNHFGPIYPSAGIGRQCKFKLCWFYVVNVQVVLRIYTYYNKISVFLAVYIIDLDFLIKRGNSIIR